MKPTCAEFMEDVLKLWPGATLVEADRGLVVIVGDEVVAGTIRILAIGRGLLPMKPEGEGETWGFRVFGFRREKRT